MILIKDIFFSEFSVTFFQFLSVVPFFALLWLDGVAAEPEHRFKGKASFHFFLSGFFHAAFTLAQPYDNRIASQHSALQRRTMRDIPDENNLEAKAKLYYSSKDDKTTHCR